MDACCGASEGVMLEYKGMVQRTRFWIFNIYNLSNEPRDDLYPHRKLISSWTNWHTHQPTHTGTQQSWRPRAFVHTNTLTKRKAIWLCAGSGSDVYIRVFMYIHMYVYTFYENQNTFISTHFKACCTKSANKYALSISSTRTHTQKYT